MDPQKEWQPTDSDVSVTLSSMTSLNAKASNSGIRINISLKAYDVAAQNEEANAKIRLSTAEGGRPICGQGVDFIVTSSGHRQSYRERMDLLRTLD